MLTVNGLRMRDGERERERWEHRVVYFLKVLAHPISRGATLEEQTRGLNCSPLNYKCYISKMVSFTKSDFEGCS